MTSIAIAMTMIGAAGSVVAQELPTTPVAICAKEGDGKGAFTAETKIGDPKDTPRLQADGTLAVVVEREVTVLDLQQLSEQYVGGDWVGAHRKAVDLLNKVTTCLASEQGAPAARNS